MSSTPRGRRRTQTALATLASVAVCAAFAVAGIGASRNDEAASLWGAAVWLGVVLGAGAAAHIAIGRWAPDSNELAFGIVGLLVGVGWVTVVRVDPGLAPGHTIAVVAGFGALVGSLFAMPLLDWCMRRPGTLGAIAIVLAALGLFGRGTDVAAGAYEPARQWLHLGAASLQPYGLAKLAVMLAACGLTVAAPPWLGDRLAFHRHVAGATAAAVGAWTLLILGGDIASGVVMFVAAWLPLWLDGDGHHTHAAPTAARSVRVRTLGGIIAAYGVGVVVLVSVNDRLSAHVRHWQNPWTAADGPATTESAFAMSAGGLSGVGPGLGSPQRIAGAHSDFVFAVVVEELGILGGASILAAFMLLTGVGAAIAQRAHGTHRLLATTATMVVGLQALLSIAGVLRLAPHTVGALPFVAHGPAALVGNCIAVGLLLAISSGGGASRNGPADVPDSVTARRS
ncbi:FtsW/RodA/SpoVE family cell cycle protein [Candidatus Poriferisodalis sp.]|uniref:FtsW/RodA/SpoVE family cell cycle protein n=1 Tax=Candidatus Poriferisodalis sp. TaxID=3101277 RepID=UPI003B011CB0